MYVFLSAAVGSLDPSDEPGSRDHQGEDRFWGALIMSAEDWLRAAKTEEQRLLGEIAKTDLFRQVEAVRAMIAVYQGKEPSPAAQASGLGPENAPGSPRVWKAA